jgi:hypothetical protein
MTMDSGIDPTGIDAAAGSRRTPVGSTTCPSGLLACPDDGGFAELAGRQEIATMVRATIRMREIIRARDDTRAAVNAMDSITPPRSSR